MHFIFFRFQKVDKVYCAGMVVKNIATKESIHQNVTHLFVEDTRNIFSCAVYDDLFYSESTLYRNRRFYECHTDCVANKECRAYAIQTEDWVCYQVSSTPTLVLVSQESEADKAVLVKKAALNEAIIYHLNNVEAPGKLTHIFISEYCCNHYSLSVIA